VGEVVGHACGEDVVTEFAILPQCLPKAGERVADTTGVQKGIRKRQRRAPRLAAASPTSPRVSSSCSPEHPRRGGLLGALAGVPQLTGDLVYIRPRLCWSAARGIGQQAKSPSNTTCR
jgi:hypothetical protein